MGTLPAPLVITSRLLPGLHIRDSAGLCEIALQHTEETDHSGKPLWRWHIDLPDGSWHTGKDLAGRGDLVAMFGALCSFLSACGESYRYSMGEQCVNPHENADLFPPAVAEWAYCYSDELAMLSIQLEEGDDDE